jgi:uroporphyrinogen-III synthase
MKFLKRAEGLLSKKLKKVHSSIKILFTGQHLEKEIVSSIPKSIVVDELPFIETKLSMEVDALAQLTSLIQHNAFIVITSQIAVDWVAANCSLIPNWTIACMKGQTQKALSDIGWGALVSYTASNGLDLAKQIASYVPKSTTIHFLGSNQRLASLPDYLNEKGFKVNELIAYTTDAKKQIIDKEYDGIVFLSPSAVNSFFDQHAINESVVLFAIGQTTANAIQKRSQNEIVVSEGVSQSELFKTIYNYYQAICY